MKPLFPVFLLLTIILTGCQAISDIFGAGVYTGAFIIVFVLGVTVLLARSFRRKQ